MLNNNFNFNFWVKFIILAFVHGFFIVINFVLFIENKLLFLPEDLFPIVRLSLVLSLCKVIMPIENTQAHGGGIARVLYGT